MTADARTVLRPRWQLTPGAHWANDPNGLVRTRDGYRVYFQHARDEPHYRRPGWASATSRDLLHWHHEGLALAGTRAHDAYSGSVLGGESPRVYYTQNLRARAKRAGRQRQALVLSRDSGRSFDVRAARVVLDENLANWRDPFVFAYGTEWRMLLAAPIPWLDAPRDARSELRLYGSRDGLRWSSLGVLLRARAAGELWEVPWLVPMHDARWLLGFSIVDRSARATPPSSACSTRLLPGRFDGRRFVAQRLAAPARERWTLDHGPDFYAAIPSDVLGAGRLAVLGWQSSWAYARRLRFAGFAGGPLSSVRTLDIDEHGPRQRSAASLDTVLGRWRSLHARRAIDAGECIELEIVDAKPTLQVSVSDAVGECARITVDAAGSRYVVTRAAVDTEGPPGYAGRWSATRRNPAAPIRLRLRLDGGALEVSGDGGDPVFSLLLATAGRRRLAIEGGGARVRLRARFSADATPAASRRRRRRAAAAGR